MPLQGYDLPPGSQGHEQHIMQLWQDWIILLKSSLLPYDLEGLENRVGSIFPCPVDVVDLTIGYFHQQDMDRSDMLVLSQAVRKPSMYLLAPLCFSYSP